VSPEQPARTLRNCPPEQTDAMSAALGQLAGMNASNSYARGDSMELPMQASATNAALLRDPNFRWLLRGGTISALGDQFSLIALPWLVLTMTGDALAMGLVIALMSIPRALFILIGGALVDRSSPKRVLMLSKYANTAAAAGCWC
jgi:hypothetical protein